MAELAFRPVTRTVARAFVLNHHSHHRAHVADCFRLGATVRDELVAVVVAEQPKAPVLASATTWEVSRLCIGPGAPHYTASRLLGRIGRVMDASGILLGVSYTRVDEKGTCYLASGWRPVAIVRGRAHDTGNRALRWLPGLYEPSTEIVDRVRWERGPLASGTACVWTGNRWVPAGGSKGALHG